MTITITRERRKKFEAIIQASDIYHYALSHLENLGQGQFAEQMVKDLADSLADAAASRTELSGVEWAIASSRTVTESDLQNPQERAALEAFERDLQLPASWSWYPAKSSEERAWASLREFVQKTYQQDPAAFSKYQTWRTQPYARGAMSNRAIKISPSDFPLSFSDFLASSAMYGGKQEVKQETPRNEFPNIENGRVVR